MLHPQANFDKPRSCVASFTKFDRVVGIVEKSLAICSTNRGKQKMAQTAQQKFRVTAVCSSEARAAELAEEHKNYTGVLNVQVIGTLVIFFCEAAKDMVLIIYGRIKDGLPGDCSRSCCCTPESA